MSGIQAFPLVFWRISLNVAISISFAVSVTLICLASSWQKAELLNFCGTPAISKHPRSRIKGSKRLHSELLQPQEAIFSCQIQALTG